MSVIFKIRCTRKHGMNDKKIFKRVIIAILILPTIGLLVKQSMVDNRIDNDFSSVYSREKYKKSVKVKLPKSSIKTQYILLNSFGKFHTTNNSSYFNKISCAKLITRLSINNARKF